MTSVWRGNCLCQAIRFEITAPIVTTLCHCRSCRLAAGAPSVAWVVVDASDFNLLAGALATFESSPGVQRGFCARCGTSLTYRSTARPDRIDITTATLDDADALAPTKEIWLSHKLAWETANPRLPHFAGSSVNAQPLPDGS